MIQVRPSEERGVADFGWLKSRHTFSFGQYYDPQHMGYRSLRVINDDRVAPGAGFGTHPHRDMEIVTYVVEGAIEHKDSTGGAGLIRAGEMQRMSAGTGIRHSESNASEADPLRFLQIWVIPDEQGIEPGYEQRRFTREERRNRLAVLAAPGGPGDALNIHQDVRILGSILEPGESLSLEPEPGRGLWLQIVTGTVRLGDRELREGDGLAIEGEALTLEGVGEADLLLFDLGR